MTSIGISLGWRCGADELGVKNKWRETKKNGYKTCVFDIGVSNYIGVCKCIEDDFKYFLDDNYITLREEPFEMKRICGTGTQGQNWIYNTYYNFAFNHESPGHARLWELEKWPGGINHFVYNNWEKFKERYSRRINNFRHYLKTAEHITFGIIRYNDDCSKLVNILRIKYPNLKFTICCYSNFPQFGLEFNTEYLKYLNITEEEYPEEWYRYKVPLSKLTDTDWVCYKYN